MKQGLNEICYGFFATLANPTRLAILERLEDGAMNVSGLADLLDQEQSMVSHNLKLLERCGFISSERRGKEKFVSLNREVVDPLFELVLRHAAGHCGAVDGCPYGL